MAEGDHQHDDELWVDCPEPEEVGEEATLELPIDVDAEVSEPDDQPALAKAASAQLKRRPDAFIDLRGTPFGQTWPRDHNLRVPVFFEQNDIRTIGHSKFFRRQVGGETRVRWFVRINSQRLRELGATPRGMQLLLEHEAQGHCRGFGHGEANPQANPAFHPRVPIKAS